MKTGIIFYSQTSNTLSVAERLSETLTAAGHDVSVQRVTASSENPQSKGPVILQNKPDAAPYDYVIFGSPVLAFSLTPVMKAYMAQLAPGVLAGKKVACFVTEHFKKQWMGGNQAVSRLTRFIKRAGSTVIHTGIVNWSSDEREEQIQRILAQFVQV